FPLDPAFADVSVDSLDRVVGVGTPNNVIVAARLTTAGTFDTTFDGDGKVNIGIASGSGAVGVAVDSLDRVVGVGKTKANESVARLTIAGTFDPSFDTDGRAAIDFGSPFSVGGVALDSMDRVVVGGTTNGGSYSDFGLVRITSVGALDPTFDVDGKVTI